MEGILFSETQRLKQWWIWLICFFVNGIFVFGFIKQVLLGQQFGNNPMGNIQLSIVSALVILLTSCCLITGLKTEIRQDGIYYKLFPWSWRMKKIGKEEIVEVSIREYNPVGDYGGWGIRYGDSRKDKALIFGGNEGIQLILTNKKKLLLGTRKPEEAYIALENIGLLNKKDL